MLLAVEHAVLHALSTENKPGEDASGKLAKTQADTICPCCQTPLSVKIPIIDRNSNTVSWRGKSTRLARAKVELLSLLLRRYPGMVSHEQLIIHLWGDDEGEFAENAVKVHVCQLRKVLKPLGIEIENLWGTGYQLVIGGAK